MVMGWKQLGIQLPTSALTTGTHLTLKERLNVMIGTWLSIILKIIRVRCSGVEVTGYYLVLRCSAE